MSADSAGAAARTNNKAFNFTTSSRFLRLHAINNRTNRSLTERSSRIFLIKDHQLQHHQIRLASLQWILHVLLSHWQPPLHQMASDVPDLGLKNRTCWRWQNGTCPGNEETCLHAHHETETAHRVNSTLEQNRQDSQALALMAPPSRPESSKSSDSMNPIPERYRNANTGGRGVNAPAGPYRIPALRNNTAAGPMPPGAQAPIASYNSAAGSGTSQQSTVSASEAARIINLHNTGRTPAHYAPNNYMSRVYSHEQRYTGHPLHPTAADNSQSNGFQNVRPSLALPDTAANAVGYGWVRNQVDRIGAGERSVLDDLNDASAASAFGGDGDEGGLWASSNRCLSVAAVTAATADEGRTGGPSNRGESEEGGAVLGEEDRGVPGGRGGKKEKTE